MQVFCLRIANKTIETILVRTPSWPYYTGDSGDGCSNKRP